MTAPSRGFFRDNSLSLVFGAVFLLTLVGQALSGLADYNSQQVAQGLATVSLGDYVTSSNFGVDVMENWQSEYLQFFLFIFATVWLIQLGSTESKEVGKEGKESDKEQKVGKYAEPSSPAWAKVGGWRTALYSRSLGAHLRPDSPAWAKAGGWRTKVYSNSLLLAFSIVIGAIGR